MKCCGEKQSNYSCKLCGKVINKDKPVTLVDYARITLSHLGNVSYNECKQHIMNKFSKKFNESTLRATISTSKRIMFRLPKRERPGKRIVLSDLLSLKKSINEYGGIDSFEIQMDYFNRLVSDFGGVDLVKDSLSFLRSFKGK